MIKKHYFFSLKKNIFFLKKRRIAMKNVPLLFVHKLTANNADI